MGWRPTGVVLAAIAAAGAAAAWAGPGDDGPAGVAVNLNAASPQAIGRVTGLDDAEAGALSDARARIGWFRSWREVREAVPALPRDRWFEMRKRARLGPPPREVLEIRLRQWRRAR